MSFVALLSEHTVFSVVSILLSIHYVHGVSLLSTGVTVTLNDIPYYIPPDPVTTLSTKLQQLNGVASVGGLVPMTVIDTTGEDFSQTVSNYTTTDDVFQDGFLQGI